MKLKRAIPALLAMSVLTGCDVDTLLAGSKKDQNIIEEGNPSNQQVLTADELKSVAAFEASAIDAAGQGLAAAGTADALKSVAALKSVGAYRIATLEPNPDDLPADDDGRWVAFNPDDKFAGHKIEDTAGDFRYFYLKGDFTPIENFTTGGKAMLKSSNVNFDLSKIKDYQAEVKLDVTVKNVPGNVDKFASLKDSRIELALSKLEATSTLLEGTFKISKGDKIDEGEITIDLNSETWSVTVPAGVDNGGKPMFVSLEKQPNGAGQGTFYGAKDGKVDYDNKRATITWDKDGKGVITSLYVRAAGPMFIPASFSMPILRRQGN